MSEQFSHYAEGLKRALPTMLGYTPVGFAFGVLAVKNGIPPELAVAMAVLHFSGSGQFVFVSLWAAGVGALSLMAGVGIVNLRYLLMSAALSPWTARVPRRIRLLMGFGVTDENFAVHITALQQGWRLALPTIFTCQLATHLAWITGCALGAFFGGFVQDVKPLALDFALPAMFLALVVPQIVSRRHLVVALVALVLSIAFKAMGSQWNVALATIIGATLGLILLRCSETSGKGRGNASC